MSRTDIMKRQEHPLFIEFWEQHWRKHARATDGRKAARETFNAHMKAGADPQDMVDGAAWFIRNLKEADRAYIPLASTWLNRGAYEDMGPMERERQNKVLEAETRRQAQRDAIPPKPAQEPVRRQPIKTEAGKAKVAEMVEAFKRGNVIGGDE